MRDEHPDPYQEKAAASEELYPEMGSRRRGGYNSGAFFALLASMALSVGLFFAYTIKQLRLKETQGELVDGQGGVELVGSAEEKDYLGEGQELGEIKQDMPFAEAVVDPSERGVSESGGVSSLLDETGEMKESSNGFKIVTPAARQPIAESEEGAGEKLVSEFLQALITSDYQQAKSLLSNQGDNHEKVAALCLILEEDYRLADSEALQITASGDSSAWAILRLLSNGGSPSAELGLELEKTSDAKWKVANINFSKLLENYAVDSSAGQLAYAPLVRRPFTSGGSKADEGSESLAVYFSYDQDALHPRSKKQLGIVAKLLRSSPQLKIVISGHADAMGSTDYNARLSASRALQSKEFLIEQGVPQEQVVTEAFGEQYPLRPNQKQDGTDNPSGRAYNRRAEIFLDFRSDET